VNSPNNFLEIIEGMRGSPSVESLCNLCKINIFWIKAYQKGVVEEN
jgi:hypothetical protein